MHPNRVIAFHSLVTVGQVRLIIGLFIFVLGCLLLLRFDAVAFKLYQFMPSASLLSYAVSENYPPAIQHVWQLNPSLNNPVLQSAATQGDADAQLVLARYYQQNNEFKKATFWLSRASHQSTEAQELLVAILLQHKQYKALDNNLRQWRLKKDHQQSALLEQVTVLTEDTELPRVINNQHCVMKIQPVSSSLAGITYANQLVSELAKDIRLKRLPFCVHKPHLLRQSSCLDKTQSSTCVLADVAEQFPPSSFSHLIVIQEQPRSFVKTGVMWLSDNAPYSLFIHELAHFAGFVDEYPLSIEKAKQHCSNLYQVPNLTWQKTDGDNTSGGLYGRAKTCDALGLKVYKRASETTFMEYHDMGTIPEEYVKRWQHQVQQPKLQVPALIAVANALERRKNYTLADVWHQQAMKFWKIN